MMGSQHHLVARVQQGLHPLGDRFHLRLRGQLPQRGDPNQMFCRLGFYACHHCRRLRVRTQLSCDLSGPFGKELGDVRLGFAILDHHLGVRLDEDPVLQHRRKIFQHLILGAPDVTGGTKTVVQLGQVRSAISVPLPPPILESPAIPRPKVDPAAELVQFAEDLQLRRILGGTVRDRSTGQTQHHSISRHSLRDLDRRLGALRGMRLRIMAFVEHIAVELLQQVFPYRDIRPADHDQISRFRHLLTIPHHTHRPMRQPLVALGFPVQRERRRADHDGGPRICRFEGGERHRRFSRTHVVSDETPPGRQRIGDTGVLVGAQSPVEGGDVDVVFDRS